MTEAEWLAATDPQPMLEFLRGKASNRKLRLYACACCRRMWHLLQNEGSRKAVEASELYADRRITQQQLAAACGVARKIARRISMKLFSTGQRTAELQAVEAAWNVARSALLKVRLAQLMVDLPASAANSALVCAELTNGNRSEEQAHLAVLLRDVIGNPFRSRTAAAEWLSPTVVAVAQAIYDQRAFDRLPILADALEDAGCADPELLGHLRGPGPHALGCWAVDLLLGKG